MILNYVLGVLLIITVLYVVRRIFIVYKIKKLKRKFMEKWGTAKDERSFNFDLINRYFVNSDKTEVAFHVISDETQFDLDLHELFKFIDRTSSKIGQQYLYFKLRTIGSLEDLLKFDELATVFENNEAERTECQVYLSNLNHSASFDLEELLHGAPIKKSKILWLAYLLSFSNLLFIALGFYYSIFFVFLLPILAANLVLHFKNKKNINYYASGVNQLSRALRTAKKLLKITSIKNHFGSVKFIGSINTIRFKTEFLGIEKYMTNELLFVFVYLFELLKIIFNLEYILFYSFIDSIISRKKEIDEMFCFIGEIDAAIAVASVKSANIPTCTPTFNPKKEIRITSLAHPLVENCVRNNVHLRHKSMLLTGSNMSGKSTFVRAVGINSLLAQTLNFSFAESFQSPFLKLYSAIRISDDLKDHKSYYLAEVLRIKELLDAAHQSEPCLFLLDEIFKGTNTVERISGAIGILSYLNQKNDLVFVSTHDVELTELVENYEQFHFSETIENDELHFDHKIKKGRLETRNAIRILELYEYPEEVLKTARNVESSYFK